MLKLNQKMTNQSLHTEENKKLIIKKYLGHKPIEVFAGVLTGIAMAFILRMFY